MFFGETAETLAAGGDALTDRVAETLREWAGHARERGVAAIFEAAQLSGMGDRVLSWQNGERHMTDLANFPITSRWPARHPDRIQLYSLNTPNGVKASIMLEETGLPYEAHLVRFDAEEQKSPEFRSLNPYGKIPAIIDPHGPDGGPLPLFETGAILVYLADKSGRLLARPSAARYETLRAKHDPDGLFLGFTGPEAGEARQTPAALAAT